jgi:hypothetical protein
MAEPPERIAKAYRSEWTALFLVAAELTRRGYTVSFTMGNRTPVADLMAGSPKTGKQFWIDVKGRAEKTAWFVSEKEKRENLFYAFVSVGADEAKDRFFIVSQEQTNQLLRERREAHPKSFGLKLSVLHENRWDILPT